MYIFLKSKFFYTLYEQDHAENGGMENECKNEYEKEKILHRKAGKLYIP